MVYDSNSRGPAGSRRNHTGGRADIDDGRDYGSGRDNGYRGARDYRPSGQYGDDQRSYGTRDYGNQRYGQREQMNRGGDDGRGDWGRESYGSDRDYNGGDHARGGFDTGGYGDRHPNDRGYSQRSFGERAGGFDRYGSDAGRSPGGGRGGYGHQPQGYSYEDRGFLARAGDEVRSWFGDDEAERRRDQDARLDERYASDRDNDYHSWRRGQIDALDRDYHEYRQENRSKFENEFSTWRTARQGQRDSLSSVKEHQEVVGSDGAHVGTVDKVRGDRILLTKSDADAGGRHHSIPSRWIDKVADKVTLSKTAAAAKQAWHDEENRQALSGWGDRTDKDGGDRDRDRGRTDLNRSFSGTY